MILEFMMAVTTLRILISITLWCLSDTEPMKLLETIGSSEIHGILAGEKVGSSESKEMLLSLNAEEILLLMTELLAKLTLKLISKPFVDNVDCFMTSLILPD